MVDAASTAPISSPRTAAARLWRRRGVAFAGAALLLLLALTGLVTIWGGIILLLAGLFAVATVRVPDVPGTEGAAAFTDNDLVADGMSRLAAALPNPCFILDTGGVVQRANERAVATFGINEGEFLPARLRYPELLSAFDRVVRDGRPEKVEFQERVPTERSFAAWFAPLDGLGMVRSILLVMDDLTAIHAADRMRVDFVANASHELRTPLASLAGFIETLQGPAKDDSGSRTRFLGIMHEQATRMSRLIDDLLSLSRVEMRAHVRPRERVDLIVLLRHVADTMAPLAQDLGVTIETVLPPGVVNVAGDRDELVQVFDNLVENACKYGQSGERVVLSLAAPDRRGAASVSVTDFGPGIPPEHVPRLTERFYRIDADSSRRHRGTGLGLAIVKHIITRHRARLQIDSTPGQGAKFTVHFPDAETLSSTATEKRDADQIDTLS